MILITWVDPTTGAPCKHVLSRAVRIGSNPKVNDIVLPFAGVAPLHAEIVASTDGGWELVAYGLSPVLLNDEPIERAPLSAGSNFSIGVISFTVAASAASPLYASSTAGRPGAVPAGAAPRRVPPAPAHVPAVPAPAQRPGSTSSMRIPVAIAATAVVIVALGLGGFLLLRSRPEPKPEPSKPAPLPTKPAPPAPAVTPTPADPFAEAKRSVVTVIAKLSFDEGFATGTGFFVTSSGRVLTNYHVVRKTDYQQVILPGTKKPIDARILSFDEARDLALLQAYVTPPVPVAPVAQTTHLKMGDTIFTLGSPAGPLLEVSLSRGIISSEKPREFGTTRLIQHDASINPGNSGGPLLDERGQVVGVNVLKVKGTSGLNFAIPIEEALTFIENSR
jgi:S1-C subfamily serine protease